MAQYALFVGSFVFEDRSPAIENAMSDLSVLQAKGVLNGQLKHLNAWDRRQIDQAFPRDRHIWRELCRTETPLPLDLIRAEVLKPIELERYALAIEQKYGLKCHTYNT